MQRISDTKIHVGNRNDFVLRHNPDWAVVNTAKTMHCEIMGWGNRPPRDHPNYVVRRKDQLLSFNWVDGPGHLFDYEGLGVERFTEALDFIDSWYEAKEILIVCDQGLSRSPTVALLYLAKRLHMISNDTFAEARRQFEILYPSYAPKGIADFVESHWEEIQ